MQEELRGENGRKDRSREALASTDRDLVEKETSPLRVLMADVKGQHKEGADRGKGISGTWRKFREKIQNN